MSRSIDEYLRSLDEGTLDSQGSITVDLVRAQGLIGSHLFSNAGNYLLKLVQAAVSMDCTEVQVRSPQDRLQVSWNIPFSDLKPEEFADVTQRLTQIINNPLDESYPRQARHLALAIVAALSIPHNSLLIGVRSQGGGVGLLWGEQEGPPRQISLPADNSVEIGSTQYVFQIRRKPVGRMDQLRSWFTGRQLVAAHESHLLEQVCRFCSVPIYLDSRLINSNRLPTVTGVSGTLHSVAERAILSTGKCGHLLAMPMTDTRRSLIYDFGQPLTLSVGRQCLLYQWRGNKDSSVYPQYPTVDLRIVRYSSVEYAAAHHPNQVYLGTSEAEGDQGLSTTKINIVPDIGIVTRPLFHHGSAIFGTRAQPVCARAYLVAPCYDKPQPTSASTVYFQVDGVLLAGVTVQLAIPNMLVMVADSEVKTDLSGLQVTSDPHQAKVFEWLNHQAADMRKNIRSQLRWVEKFSFPQRLANRLRHDYEISED